MFLVLMGLFSVSLALDEYSDLKHAIQDCRIEACIELETEDFEWDEMQAQSVTQCLTMRDDEWACQVLVTDNQPSAPYISDKQKIGLVRRYAPRKALVCYNCALT